MAVAAITNVRDLIEILVTAASLVGGSMAIASGSSALGSNVGGDPPDVASSEINRALGWGFAAGLPLATAALIVLGI